MGDIETTVKIPQIPTVIPSVIDVSSTKSYEDVESRTCPLCRSEVRLFFINFNDKMLMCENTECEFPFGYEELVFVKEAEGIQSHVEIDTRSLRTKMTKETPACSMLSTACWSEIEKINKVYDSEDSQAFEQKALEPKEYMSLKHLKRRPKEVDESGITKSLKEIKALNTKIEEVHPTVLIKNESFLKNLLGLQSKTNYNHTIVMKPEEIKLVTGTPEVSTSGLTIDIKAEEGSLSSININITDIQQHSKSGGDTFSSVGDPV